MAKDAAAPPIDGVAIRLADGKDWIVPPLRIDQLQRYLPMLKEIAGLSPTTPWAWVGAEKIDELCGMIADALSRNYPEITKDKVCALLDLRTIGRAVAAAMNSGPAQTPPAVPPSDRDGPPRYIDREWLDGFSNKEGKTDG